MTIVAWLSALFAAVPLGVAWSNLRGFTRPRERPPERTAVSILLPARDEAAGIERAVRDALASVDVAVEVIVLDDDSTDATAAIVAGLAFADTRVRLLRAPPLPAGWAGKQRACHLLGEAARFEVLMFVDVDVRLAPEAAAAAAGRLLAAPSLGLVSGFPRELTLGFAERLVIPWIHVLLLGYLPMGRMRASARPSYGAACGQWIAVRRDAYRAAGGHAATPMSRHDGTSLPRTMREAGWRTDVFDGGALATCRMYDGLAAVWRGFSKTPGEGLATWRGLPVWTLLIGLGHVLPVVLLVAGLALDRPALAWPGACGVACNVALRAMLCLRFGQSWTGAWLHPVGAAMLLANQWASLLRDRFGRPAEWRGRRYVGRRGP